MTMNIEVINFMNKCLFSNPTGNECISLSVILGSLFIASCISLIVLIIFFLIRKNKLQEVKQ